MPNFARHEHHASPLLGIEHALQVVARQAHAAHDVDLEHGAPVLVGRVEEGLGLVDAEVVDQDVDRRKALDDGGAAFGGGQVDGRALRLGRRDGALDLGRGLGHRRLGAPVDDHGRAHAGQADGGCEADALGRAGDERHLACQVQIHDARLLGCSAIVRAYLKHRRRFRKRPRAATLLWQQRGSARLVAGGSQVAVTPATGVGARRCGPGWRPGAS